MDKHEKNEKIKPDWVKIKPAELKEHVINLHKEGNSPAKIGLILRDNHGIPKAKIMGKRISEILNDEGIKLDQDKKRIEIKIKKIEAHLAKHKHDFTAKRSLNKNLWITAKLKN